MAKGPGNTIYSASTLEGDVRQWEIQADNTLVLIDQYKVSSSSPPPAIFVSLITIATDENSFPRSLDPSTTSLSSLPAERSMSPPSRKSSTSSPPPNQPLKRTTPSAPSKSGKSPTTLPNNNSTAEARRSRSSSLMMDIKLVARPSRRRTRRRTTGINCWFRVCLRDISAFAISEEGAESTGGRGGS